MDPIVELEREWRALAPKLTLLLLDWRRREPGLAPFSSAQQLLRFLQRFDADPDSKDAALAALLRRAQTDPSAGRLILQALLPGLKHLAARLIRDRRAREEVWSTLLAAVWERIYSYPLLRRPQRIAANLLLDTRLALRQERELGRKWSACQVALEDLPLPPPRLLPFGLERPLRRAVDAGAISAEEAELIAQTRIDGTPLVDLCAAEQVPYDALRVRRRRAERRLLLFLGRPDVRFEGSNRRSFSARVVGDGHAGSAGRGAAHRPEQRR